MGAYSRGHLFEDGTYSRQYGTSRKRRSMSQNDEPLLRRSITFNISLFVLERCNVINEC